MYQTVNSPDPPNTLIEYLQMSLNQGAGQLRRRAVLARPAGGDWLLLCCAVEAFPDSGPRPDPVAPRRYPPCVLYEDWLTPEECRKFIDDVQNGEVTLGDIRIERRGNPSWRIELLPLKNSYMGRAGVCAATRFEEGTAGIAQGPLLAPGEPYYPDLIEAAGNWLPFTIYHGDHDARNQEIIFLLPEARAFFASAGTYNGVWQIDIGGTGIDRLSLTVKGAYWEGSCMTHFEKEVTNGKARLSVPDDVDRLEYVLTDSDGTVYDLQREDRFYHTGLGRQRLDGAARDLAEQVRTACLEGEGMRIEFKPFIDCERGMGTKANKTKLRELITTVVAFANTQGGRIYIGIDDDCCVSGIAQELEQWAKAEVSEDAANRYRGALTRKIKDDLVGDVPVRVSYTLVDDAPVMIVDVAQSAAKPVMVRGDNILYVRAGASNRQRVCQVEQLAGPGALARS